MPMTITETRNICAGSRTVVLLGYSEAERDDTAAAQISNNTAQTWQPNRGRAETLSNTIQGKVAEELLHQYLLQNHPDIKVLPYDEIRNDNFQKHAPFDFLVWASECNIDRIVEAIQSDITNSGNYVRISHGTRALCQSENVKILEVKSTKITGRHKSQCAFNQGDYSDIAKVAELTEVILNDDYLTYPHLCRSTLISNFTVNNYISLLQSRNINVNTEEEMRQFEISNQLADVFVRVYADEAEHAGLLLGWIDKNSFYQNAVIKRMPQRGKSELALYFAVPLRSGNSLECFPDLFNTR